MFFLFSLLAASPIDSDLANEIVKGAGDTALLSRLTGAATALDPRILVARIIAGALGLVGLIFIARIVYAGVLWFNAQGDTDAVKKSQKIIFQSSLGAVLLFSSYAIAQFLQFRLVNNTQANILDALTECSSTSGACCQEWANFQNFTTTRGTGSQSSWSSVTGGSPDQQRLLNEWKNCRERIGGFQSNSGQR